MIYDKISIGLYLCKYDLFDCKGGYIGYIVIYIINKISFIVCNI